MERSKHISFTSFKIVRDSQIYQESLTSLLRMDLKIGLKFFTSCTDLLGLENLIFSEKKNGFTIQSAELWDCCWKASIWWCSEGKRVNLYEIRRNKMSSAKLMATLVICLFLVFISRQHTGTTRTWGWGGGASTSQGVAWFNQLVSVES